MSTMCVNDYRLFVNDSTFQRCTKTIVLIVGRCHISIYDAHVCFLHSDWGMTRHIAHTYATCPAPNPSQTIDLSRAPSASRAFVTAS